MIRQKFLLSLLALIAMLSSHAQNDMCAPASQCNYLLQMQNMTDSGWNGTVIGFRQDGEVVATATLASGSSGSTYISLCTDGNTEIFVQYEGYYTDEISFTLYDTWDNEEYVQNSGNTLSEDDVLYSFTSHCPDCLPPSSVSVSYPSSTSINIQWTASFSEPAEGYEYVVSTSSSYPSGSGTPVVSGTSALVTGLSVSTEYYVFVRSICAVGEESPWTNPLGITTSCTESSLPLSEGLNSESLPCWETEIITDGTAQWGLAPGLEYVMSSENPVGLSPFEGSGFLRFNSYSCDTGDQIRLISTPIETTGISSVDVDFIWSHDPDYSLENDGVQVQYSFDKMNWVNAGVFLPRFSSSITGWSPQTVTLPNDVNGQAHVYIAFLFTGQGGNDCYIDNILIRETPACQKPSNIKATHLTENFARVEWTASVSSPSEGYLWELRTSGTVGSGATGLVASGNTASGILFAEISGLNALTNYTFYSKSDCQSEQSDWTWPYKFRTVASVINVFPFDETYETSSPTIAGWQNEYSFGQLNWTYATGAGSGAVNTAHDSPRNARFRSTTYTAYTTKLVSPPMDLTVMPSGARLKFWYANESWYGRQNELRVYYKTTYGDDWNLIPSAVYMTNQNSWTEVTLTLPQTGSDYYIAFEGLNKFSRGIALDDIRVEPIECPIPVANAVTGRNSAFVYWDVAGDAETLSYEWELRTSGEPGSGVSGLKASAITAEGVLGKNVSGLIANTTYYLYVRTRCGEDDYSLWSEEYEFTTTNIAAPSNDHPATNNPALGNVAFVYPNCLGVQGTTVGSTPYFHQDYSEVWYSFTAISNGVSIKVASTEIDPVIFLYSGTVDNLTRLDMENVVSGTGTEILNYDGLIAGQTYRIAIASANETDGTFSLCLQKLRKPVCGTVSDNLSLCSSFRIYPTGAANTTYSFSNAGSVTSNELILLSNPALQLAYDNTYTISLTANYNLLDGAGNPETIQVSNPDNCQITIAPHPSVEVRSNQRCANEATLYRASYLTGTPFVCGAIGYDVEFTRVSNCAGNAASEPEVFTKSITGSSPSISLGYAFNHLPVAGNPHAGYWSVRWRPIFAYGSGEFGNAQIIKVNNTSASVQGMDLMPSSELLSSTSTTIVTNNYPNPNDGNSVNITVSGSDNTTGTIAIIDALGKVIEQKTFAFSNNFNTVFTFDRKLSEGLYFIDYNIGGTIKREKFLVIK